MSGQGWYHKYMGKKIKLNFNKLLLLAIFLFVIVFIFLFKYKAFIVAASTFIGNFGKEIHLSFDKKGSLYWPIENQSLVTVKNSSQMKFSWNCNISNEDNSINDFNSKMENVILGLNKYLRFLGMKEVKNINFEHDKDFGTILGYENRELCQLTYSNFCFGDKTGFKISGTFTCSSIADFERDKADQLDILTNLAGQRNAISKIEMHDNYYGISMGSPIGPGYYIIAKKEGSKWINITGGQDSPMCDTLNKFKVPHQISYASQCYDKAGKIIKNIN